MNLHFKSKNCLVASVRSYTKRIFLFKNVNDLLHVYVVMITCLSQSSLQILSKYLFVLIPSAIQHSHVKLTTSFSLQSTEHTRHRYSMPFKQHFN